MTEKIAGIFFDFGGTLFDYYPSNIEMWIKIAKRLGVDISLDDPRIREGMRKQSTEFERLGKPFSQISKTELHTLNCHVLAALEIDGKDAQPIIDAEFTAREEGTMFQLYSDAPETLRKIKQMGIKIGLLSNTTKRLAALRRPTMEENGILHFFDTIILSVEVGFEKPQKEIFQIALQKLGINNPAQAMHVGDSPITDVKGARNAGLIPVLFDPIDLYPIENVIKISALSDILQYLK